jgi:hypothetical protein
MAVTYPENVWAAFDSKGRIRGVASTDYYSWEEARQMFDEFELVCMGAQEAKKLLRGEYGGNTSE